VSECVGGDAQTGEGDIADKQATMERFEQKISGTLASTQAMLKKMMAVPRPSLHTPLCSNYPSARAHARTHAHDAQIHMNAHVRLHS
jgi:hypothetical protein